MTDDFDANLRRAVADASHDARRIFGDSEDPDNPAAPPAGAPHVDAGAGVGEGHPEEPDDFDSNLRAECGNPDW